MENILVLKICFNVSYILNISKIEISKEMLIDYYTFPDNFFLS